MARSSRRASSCWSASASFRSRTGLPGQEVAAELVRVYPFFAQEPPAGWLNDVQEAPRPRNVPAGVTLISEGATCHGFPLLLSGEVRVVSGSSDGREIELYRVRAGEVCVASAMSLISGEPMEGYAATTLPTRVLSLPPEVFLRWTAHEAFRRFVFGAFASRMRELSRLAGTVAFQRLDRRLATRLVGHGAVVRTTHQALADELGTAREIVTRLLHRFESAGWVTLSRECIELRNADALAGIASGQPH